MAITMNIVGLLGRLFQIVNWLTKNLKEIFRRFMFFGFQESLASVGTHLGPFDQDWVS
jgi:hypothetical protein